MSEPEISKSDLSLSRIYLRRNGYKASELRINDIGRL
jgi:hypothetical protein